jgi:hypothetical protein
MEAEEMFSDKDPYYREMKQMVMKSELKIIKHRREMKEQGLYVKDSCQKQYEMRKKAMFVLKRKWDQENLKLKRKYFLLFKWSLISKLKNQNLDSTYEKIRKYIYTNKIIKRVKALQIYKIIMSKFT